MTARMIARDITSALAAIRLAMDCFWSRSDTYPLIVSSLFLFVDEINNANPKPTRKIEKNNKIKNRVADSPK